MSSRNPVVYALASVYKKSTKDCHEVGGGILGKRRVISEEELESMKLLAASDVLGTTVRMLGFDRILVRCQDGKERLCRVRGKLKRRVWVREGDIVLVSPWDFQSDKRGDIFWRYRKDQTEWLRSHRYLTM
ncbi:translation initiation factor eIF-1A [Candidatus Bathyarchaeota archaeon CG07_land_8_20_14_0_80_47_9]|nr:MAG: translation initiation factor eIF-1A [Candidatus Bathyarchaeota archaeon CG07_land_8_20_14_0_80_47_9]